ncbi:hypothetical protein WJ02_25515 [Burkholderia vietnamiensis]|nr:hypothetical protein WJ02_25515 [Burkholderia vietnamiensis]
MPPSNRRHLPILFEVAQGRIQQWAGGLVAREIAAEHWLVSMRHVSAAANAASNAALSLKRPIATTISSLASRAGKKASI